MLWSKNISDGDELPRTPPWRLGGSVEVGYQNFLLVVDLVHTGRQSNTASGEDSTGSHTLLGVYAGYIWETDHAAIELFAKVRNLTDELARVHTSFLRDTAPLQGRGINAGISARF